MTNEATPKTVAEWMVGQLERARFLSQEIVVHDIEANFGPEFVYLNTNGNLAINRKVLDEFKKLTGDTVIWDRSDKSWRKRQPNDSPGRQQY